jgi:DNA helicase-2/ATP-dependent DNA helicase PcrA
MKLNREQDLASRPDGGVTLVIAGAGTGKTSALIEKTRNLIAEGAVRAENILILTFSRKAADEIKERLVARAGPEGGAVTSGTFHSFCYRLIRDHGMFRPGPEGPGTPPKIIDGEHGERIIDGLIRQELASFQGLPLSVIRQLLAGGRPVPRDIERKLENFGIRRKVDLLALAYRDYKAAGNLMDFGDLMRTATGLLESDGEFRAATRARYTYLLVDEFQDTSEDNFRLLKQLLPESNPNLFAVGDDWQSIYGFRNARVEYIVKMRNYFPGVRIIKLRTNYRSRREIVDLSSGFIRKNRFRTSKKLISHAGKGGLVRAYAVASRAEETDCIAGILARENGRSAVLYRNNWQGDIIRKHLGIADDGEQEFPAALMTMHASKGLEFDTVIVAGISDLIIPDRKSDLEEERRLFYVALTRAKRSLYLVFHLKENGELPRFANELGLRPARFSGAS